MRQLTAFASYFDNLGALLIGRARFYNMDGSPAEVFHRDSVGRYVTGGSVVFTNSSGQLEPQVFFDDHDYLVVFDKYIGGGTMAEDDDPESWEEQGSAVDQYNTIGIELSGGSMRVVSTIDGLRSTRPVGNSEIVLLTGYNRAGDKPSIYYQWNQNATSQDNGGSVIKVTEPEEVSQGRWVIYDCPEYLDVRHFGAFPLPSIEESQEQRNAIQLAYNYAHGMGRGIYFPANVVANYFDISGLTLIGVDSHPSARIFCKSGMSSTVSSIKSVYCTNSEDYAGQINLAGATVRTSWGGDSSSVWFNPSAKLIMDSPIYTLSKSWSGIAVEIETYTSGCTFDGCEISSAGKIDDAVTIQNCELKSAWFSDDYNWQNLTSLSNTIVLKNCKDANTYILLKNKQNERNYGDLEEKTISNVTLLDGCVAENAAFTDVTLAGNSELHNISGNVLLTGSTPELNWIDCWMTITSVVNAIGTFQFRRGSLTSSSTLTIAGGSVFVDVSINAQLDCRNDLKLDRCDINQPVKGIRLNATRNDIFSTLSIQMESGRLDGIINCNRFFDGGYLAVIPLGVAPGTTPVATLAISITGNYSDHDFWDDSAFNGVSHTTSGKIVYEGNYGGCPGNRASYRSGLSFKMKVPGQTWGAITDPALDQDDNSIWMVNDNRSQDNSTPERQFWWSIKINRTHNFDTLKIWRCKYLNYNRTVRIKGLFAADFTATNGELVSFSFNPYTWQRQVGPAPLDEKVQQETMTFQQVASSYYGPNLSGTYPSRLTKLISGASQLNGSQLWEYEVI